MSPLPVSLPEVLPLFALLFTARWIGRGQRDQALALSRRGFYERLFTLRVTLWCLIFQRLSFDQTLAGVMDHLRQGGADRLGARRRKLSRRVRSHQTSAYSQARQRMPLALLQAALAHLAESVLALAGVGRPGARKPTPSQRPRQLLDGSTLRVLATPALVKAYRPARGRHGASDWCLMRIVVGFCARTGAILSAWEQAVEVSEQRMAWTLMAAARAFTIWVADRNFGVWSVVDQARRHRQDVLVRLTRARATKLAGGRPLHSGEDRAVGWRPTRHDQSAAGSVRAVIAGRLVYVRLQRAGRWIDLWLFTTLDAADYPLELLVRWYGQRWQAELHFRSVKTQMRLAELDVCSPEMARKELYAGLLAYSLVRAVLWGAGERLETGVQTLSFSQARRVLLGALEDWARAVGSGAGSSQRWVQRLLAEVAAQRLPVRRQPRPSQVRRVRSRVSKWPTLRGSRAAAQKRCEQDPKSS